MAPLQLILRVAGELGHLSPLRGHRHNLRVSLYADDAIVFSNPVKAEVDVLKQLMEGFGLATGLRLNPAKSSVAQIHCQHLNLDEILQSFGGQRVAFPIPYGSFGWRGTTESSKENISRWEGLLAPSGRQWISGDWPVPKACCNPSGNRHE